MSFDCLEKGTSILGTHFIEASAGTGKTFSIEHVFIRLLLEEGLEFEKILVVTFTNLAANELKMRIRNSMENALIELQKKSSIRHYLRPYFIDEKASKEAENRLKEALLFYDHMQIFTIHGFCMHMLKEYAFDLSLDLEGWNHSHYPEVFQKTMQDFLRYDLASTQIFSAQVAEILRTSSFSQLRKNFNVHCAKNNDIESLRKNIASIFEKISVPDKDLFISDFSSLYPLYKKIRGADQKDLLEQWLFLYEAIICKKDLFSFIDRLLEKKLALFHFLHTDNLRKNADLLAVNLHYPDFLFQIINTLHPLLQKLMSKECIHEFMAQKISQKIGENFPEEEMGHPEEILHKMQGALRHQGFKEAVQNKYAAVIIDEFQDTDPIQWDIFYTLFSAAKNLSAFYLIGDPKQSIYGFRNADIYTYLKAFEDLQISEKKFLDTNYRSHPHLLAALNALFSPPFTKDWLYLPKKEKFIDFLPVKPGKNDLALQNTDPRLIFCISQKRSKKNAKWPTDQMENEDLFPFIAAEIIRLHEKEKIPFSEFAVLVKDRYQAERLGKYFFYNHLPYVFHGNLSVISNQMIRNVSAVIDAALYPKNPSMIKKVLAGPYFQRVNICDDTDEAMQFFLVLHQKLFKEGFDRFVHQFFHGSFMQQTVYQHLLRQKKKQFYADTEQIFSYLMEKFAEEKLSPFALKDILEKTKDFLPEDDERIKKQFFSEKENIQIMSMHKSKGLEFSVVFGLGLAARNATKEKDSAKISEIDAEKMRQLYVVMTRAKEYLYVPLLLDTNDQPIEKGKGSPIEIFFAHGQSLLNPQEVLSKLSDLERKNLISTVYLDQQKPLKNVRHKTAEKMPLKKEFSSIFSRGYSYSFSALSTYEGSSHFLKEDFPIDLFPPGADTGVIIHAIFETLFKSNASNFYQREFISSVVNAIIRATSLEPFLSQIETLVYRALHIPLLPQKFALRDICLKNAMVEMEFLFPDHSEDFLKGFVDLVFIHEDKYYLVDWKTNYLGNSAQHYERASLEKEMEAHHYFLQGAIYSEALERFMRREAPHIVFGGAFYMFLRGLLWDPPRGILHFFPDRKMVLEGAYDRNH